MNLYVGNLSPEVTEDDLRGAFEPFGQISSIKVIKDKFTGEPRGFGFVEMPGKQQAKSAMENLNGTELKGKKIIVNQAREQTDRRHGGGGGRRGGGNWKNRF
ncbi:MAG: RNA-binding protein [candidate division KSB1 bacterium]|nr:RNA-binding protein [candidate division KSB1 bacterium]MDZ7334498.1 RNA-binding protein [candidate division KSB1 bacterium]MDZ7357955.1 RNA-binding protein [candidate division KSB1 bacterium]MDZ7400993.1 RNA-binding protein [candidate division KSB1 bacterium]